MVLDHGKVVYAEIEKEKGVDVSQSIDNGIVIVQKILNHACRSLVSTRSSPVCRSGKLYHILYVLLLRMNSI